MPTGVSTYGADQLIGIIFGQVNTVPATFYMALLSQMPDPSNDGTQIKEPPATDGNGDATSYQRASIVNNTSNWNDPSGGIVTNKTVVLYPQATGDWGVVSHYALCTAATGGQVLLYGALDTARRVPKDHSARFDPGLLTFAVTGTRQSIVGSG